MKTAKEWAYEYWQKKTQAERAFIPFLKQVQLDAWKQGMTDASQLIVSGPQNPLQEGTTIQQRIIEVRDRGLTL